MPNIQQNIKSLDDTGRFAGYASVFNMVDSQRDIILRGAFLKSIKGRTGEIKLLWQHQQDDPIGVFTKMFEDARGLYVEGRLLLNVRRGREAHSLLKSGAISGLSIGYTPSRYRIDKKTGIRTLSEINLLEISLVTFPANEAANVTVVKGKNLPVDRRMAQHAMMLRKFREDDAFDQDTRGAYMTLTEKLDRLRSIRRFLRKSKQPMFQ